MKYALINKTDSSILKASDEPFTFVPEEMEMVELTEEQAAKVESSSKSLFLVEDRVITSKEKAWAENPELIKASLRPLRDRLLADSDWTQLNDSPIYENDRDAWAAYRQDLRDLTDNIDENGEVEFPVAP